MSMQRVVWITGASSGIGEALAHYYAKQGWHVAVTARNAAGLAEMAQLYNGKMKAYPADITHAEAMTKTVAAIVADFGQIDVAVLNAGTHIPVHGDALDAHDFQKLMDINYIGTVHSLIPCINAMKQQGQGHIAVVSSIAGVCGLPTSAAYGATKAALINMCEALKVDLERLNITLTLVLPGFVKTPLTDKNPFPMPFIISAEDAAQRLYNALAKKPFEITFPKRFTWQIKFLRFLPYPLYFWVLRKFLYN